MGEILPSINCHFKDDQCVTQLVRTIEPFAPWAHIDVADARFTFNRSWNDPAYWLTLKTPVKAEVHLMVEEPETEAPRWLAAGAKRIIIHTETLRGDEGEKRFASVRGVCSKAGAQLFLALSPETPLSPLMPYQNRVDGFQILSVHPGPSGQKFLPLTLEKVIQLRAAFAKLPIEVDGGMNEETLPRAREAGATHFVAGSYIFNSPHPEAAYKTLANISI